MPTPFRHLQRCAEALTWPLSCPNALDTANVDQWDQLHPSHRERFRLTGARLHPDEWANAHWNRKTDMLTAFVKAAQRTLRIEGEVATLKPYTPTLRGGPAFAGEEILWWRHLSLRVPADIWIAAAALNDDTVPKRVRVLPVALRPRAPTAHLHLHAGALNHEADVWANLGKHLKSNAKLPTPLPHDPDGARWRAWIARARLGWSMWRNHFRERHPASFLDCGECFSQQTLAADLVQLVPQNNCRAGTEVQDDTWYFLQHVDEPSAAADRIALRELLRAIPTQSNERQIKLLRAFCLQLIRVRVLLHQQLTVDRTEPGLNPFRETSARAKAVSRSQAETGHSELDVYVEEVRIAPPPNGGKLVKDWAKGQAKRGNKGPERRLVIHFSRSSTTRQGASNIAAGHSPWPNLYRENAQKHEHRLQNDLHTHPELLSFVRGLDLAGSELEGPLFLFAPTLRRLRATSEAIMALRHPPEGGSPFGMTVHCGEDFRHIASGLRAVHETIAYGVVRFGDRLGHALALGCDVQRWAKRRGHAIQPRLERLLDIEWMLDCAQHWPLNVSGATLHRLQAEAKEHRAHIWNTNHSDLPALWTWLKPNEQDIAPWEHLLTEPANPASNDNESRFSALLDATTWANAEERIEVAAHTEADLLVEIQRALGNEVAALQLIIEVNPTSNLLVADLDNPLDQPMFHLRPVDPNAKNAQRIAISADDPLQFATHLDDEMAYAWAGMTVMGGVSPAYARQWLEEAAANALAGVFGGPPRQTRH